MPVTPSSRIRVLVVDDSVVIRRLVVTVLEADPAIEVVGTAPNGRIAVELVASLRPDVVTLDIEMPEMDGLTALAEIRRTNRRMPIIMFSTLTEAGASATLEALHRGASDFVTKPANVGGIAAGMEAIKVELIPKIHALAPRARFTPAPSPPRPAGGARSGGPAGGSPFGIRATDRSAVTGSAVTGSAVTGSGVTGSGVGAGGPSLRPAPTGAHHVRAVAVGVSTGGPTALAEIWAALPRLSVPVLIVQHMPPVFTEMLARRLDGLGTVPIVEASDGLEVVAGHAYLAPGDHHMVLEPFGEFGRIRITSAPPVNSCRPAVDPMFDSVARVHRSGVLGVVLTGMGSDGTDGGRSIVEAGGRMIAQDEPSSVVWGMPGSLVHAGLAEAVVPLDRIAGEIARRCTRTVVGSRPTTGAIA